MTFPDAHRRRYCSSSGLGHFPSAFGFLQYPSHLLAPPFRREGPLLCPAELVPVFARRCAFAARAC